MIEKTITYKDFLGNDRTETFRFHLSQTELLKMDLGVQGSLTKKLETLLASPDVPTLMTTLDTLIEASYGVVSADGRQFIKNKEEYNAFRYTAAYDKFMTELLSSDEQAAAFVEGVMPPELVEEVKKARAKEKEEREEAEVENGAAPSTTPGLPVVDSVGPL